jgi:hypothetical protein
MRIVSLFSIIFIFFVEVAHSQNGNFRSIATGNWGTATTWERDADSNGSYEESPSTLTPLNTDGTIIIQSGHVVTVTTNVTVDETTINSGGTVQIDPIISLTVADGTGDDLIVNGTLTLTDDLFFDGSFLVVNGQVVNTGSITINDPTLSSVSFNAASSYAHNQVGGSVPDATWNATSTISIDIGASNSPPTNLDQTFGNFVWNSPSQNNTTNLALSGSTTTIVGNLTISASNNRVLLFSTGTGVTVQVSGNVSISGSNTRYALTSSGNVTLNVGGNFSYTSGGTSYLATTATGVLNVDGDFTISAGTLQGSATSVVNFTGTTVQTFTSGGTFTNVSFNINSNAIVNAGTSSFSGIGSFDMGIGSTLSVGSTDASGAVQSGTTGGNIRVSGTRTYAGGCTFVYNGAGAQFVGNGLPTDINLEINNSSGVGLSAATTISVGRTLTLTSGNLSIGANTLTLNGSVSVGSGALEGGNSSNLTIGGTGSFGTLSFATSTTLNDFTLNRTSSGNVTLGSALTTLGTFTQTAGDLTLNGNSFTINNAFARTGGTIICDASATLIVSGTGALPASVAMSGSLNTFTLDRAAATFTTGASFTVTNLNLNSGTLSNSGTITMASNGVITRNENGSMNLAPTATTSYDIVYDIASAISTGVELLSSTTALDDLTKIGSATLTLDKGITINGILTLTSGTLDAGANSIDFKGNFVSNSPSTLTSSSLTFSGITTISGGTTPTFNNITVTGTLTPPTNLNINGNLVNNGTLNAGAGTVTFGGITAITGSSTSSFNNVSISGSSTLTAPSGIMNVAGTFANSGTFTHNGGTVNFNGTTTFSGTTPDFSGFTIAGSSTVTAPTTLSIAGNFANSGTFTTTGSTIIFNGTTGQEISGGSSTTTFNNLTVNTSGTFNNDDNVDLTGTLAVGNTSIFDADGDGTGLFTLISNASGTARVADLTGGGNVLGQVRFQRYFDGAGNAWRNFGVAVNGATVSNITGGGFTINGNDLAYYDETETALGTVNDGWVLQQTFGSSISNTRGYSMWTRAAQMTRTITFTGTLNTGNQSPTVSYTSTASPNDDGWNLVNNPFASTIDWDSFTAKTGLDNTVSVWNTASLTYDTWNGTTGTLTNGLISSGQAFYVHATSAPTLTIQEAAKVSSSTTFLRQEPLANHLMVSLLQGSKIDKTYVHFRPDADDNLDSKFDGLKLSNGIYNLSTLAASGENLSINSMGDLGGCDKIVKMKIDNIAVGSYTMKFDDVSSFPLNYKIILNDNFALTKTTLTEGFEYSFEVTPDASSQGDNRFELEFASDPINTNLNLSTLDNCSDAVVVSIDNSESGLVYKLMANGIELATNTGNGGKLDFSVLKSNLNTGINPVDIYIENTSCLLNQTILNGVSVDNISTPTITSVVNGKACMSSEVELSASGAPVNGFYRWYETIDAVDPIVGENEKTILINGLTATSTYYVSAVNLSGCESDKVGVLAEVTAMVSPIAENLTLCSGSNGSIIASGALNDEYYKWYLSYSSVDPIANENGSALNIDNVQTSTSYFVSIANNMGCESDRTRVEVAVNVISIDTPNLSVIGNVLTTTLDGDAYQWYKDNEPIEGAIKTTYEVINSGSYHVVVTKGDCSVNSTTKVFVVTGVDDILYELGLNIYPNPVSERLNIRNNKLKDLSINLFDLKGKTIFTNEDLKTNGNNSYYDMNDLLSGMYILNIEDGSKVISLRIIKK